MGNKPEQQTYHGHGFVSFLQLLFIGLKLTGHIDWSWWWVLSPIWLSILLVIILLTVAMVFIDGK